MSPIEQAIREAELGDCRRNARVAVLVSGIVRGHTSDTNAATATGQSTPWAQSMGSYRLFNNDGVTLSQAHGPVRAALQALAPKGQRLFVVHDFSVVDYSKHSDKLDRIQVGNEKGMGYDLYTALVLDAEGRPLGPAVFELHTAKGCLSSECGAPIPFVDHLEQAERGVEATIRQFAGCELVHVADREFDDVLLQRRLHDRKQLYVIRALNMGRSVLHGQRRCALRNVAAAVQRVALETVEHNGTRFEQWGGETVVTFDRPSLRGRKRGARPIKGKPLEVRVVVTELRGVGTNERHEWVLLTNVNDPIEQLVAIYRARWRIERLFYFAKVGLRLEQWRQQTGEATAQRLAITMLAAMTIYQLKATNDAPTLKKVATLGGWLGRKGDAMGPIVLMRGMLVLLASLDAIAKHGVDGLTRLAEDAGLGFAIPAALTLHRSSPLHPTAIHPRHEMPGQQGFVAK